MKFIFEVIDEVAKAEIEAPNIEILNCISMLDEPLKEVPIPKEDFIKALALDLTYNGDASEEDNEYKAIELLKRALDEMIKVVDKQSKPNLTDLDKAALKAVLPAYKWVTCDRNGVVYVHANKPFRDGGLGVWYDRKDNSSFLVNKAVVSVLFEWLRWEDEPWYIPDLLG